MKIEYAPPGTDPTQLATTAPKLGLRAFLEKNWLLVAGLCALILLVPKFIHFAPPEPVETEMAAVAEATVDPDMGPLPVPGLPGWCEGPGGAPAPPGVHHIGNLVRICANGGWFLPEAAKTEIQSTP